MNFLEFFCKINPAINIYIFTSISLGIYSFSKFASLKYQQLQHKYFMFVIRAINSMLLISTAIFLFYQIVYINQNLPYSLDALSVYDSFNVHIAGNNNYNQLFAVPLVFILFITAFYFDIYQAEVFYNVILYIASAFGVIFATNFINSFFYTEIMTFHTVALIWLSSKRTRKIGFYYAINHIVGGILILSGFCGYYYLSSNGQDVDIHNLNIKFLSVLVKYHNDAFGLMISKFMIILGIAINIGSVPFSYWITETYSRLNLNILSIVGTISTKVMVFLCLYLFGQSAILEIVGIVMIVLGATYSILEVKLNRMFIYNIISFLGYILTFVNVTESDQNLLISMLCFGHMLTNFIVFLTIDAISRVNIQVINNVRLIGMLKENYSYCILLCMALYIFAGLPFSLNYFIKSYVVSAIELSTKHYLFYEIISTINLIIVSKILIFLFKDNSKKHKSTPTPNNTNPSPIFFLLILCYVGYVAITIKVNTNYFPSILPSDLYKHYKDSIAFNHIATSLCKLTTIILSVYLFRNKIVYNSSSSQIDINAFYNKTFGYILQIVYITSNSFYFVVSIISQRVNIFIYNFVKQIRYLQQRNDYMDVTIIILTIVLVAVLSMECLLYL